MTDLEQALALRTQIVLKHGKVLPLIRLGDLVDDIVKAEVSDRVACFMAVFLERDTTAITGRRPYGPPPPQRFRPNDPLVRVYRMSKERHSREV